MTIDEQRLRSADRAADARARLYAGELRALLGRFEDEQRHVDWPDDQADTLGLLFADLRSVLNRMDAGEPQPVFTGGRVDPAGFDSLVAEAGADVLPFSKRKQLEYVGGGIGMRNAGRTVSHLSRTIRLRRSKPAQVIEADIWRDGLGACVVCTVEGGSCRGPVQGHHVIAKSFLKRHGFTDFLLDIRNRVPVCEHRHEQHTSGYKPIPRTALPPSVFEFAAELGIGWYIDRFYGDEAPAA